MRDDAEAIWTAAMRAVQPESLVADRLSLAGAAALLYDGRPLDPLLQFDDVDRIVVVGAGKAAAGMAAAMERLLGPEGLARHRVTGLVSVPAGCGRRLAAIEVRETRPAKANLPTPAVVQATREIMTTIAQLGSRDLAITVITGGGSALLAAPKEGGSEPRRGSSRAVRRRDRLTALVHDSGCHAMPRRVRNPAVRAASAIRGNP